MKENLEKDYFVYKKRGKIRLFLYFLFFIFFIAIILAIALNFLLLPAKIEQKFDGQFNQIPIYQLESAKLYELNYHYGPLIDFTRKFPAGFTQFIIDSLSSGWKDELQLFFFGRLDETVSSQKILHQIQLQNTKGFLKSLEWNNLDKNKEDLYYFYRQKLLENNYQTKEHNTEFKSIIYFWQKETYGKIIIQKNLNNNKSSVSIYSTY